jgi:hypothetical protein
VLAGHSIVVLMVLLMGISRVVTGSGGADGAAVSPTAQSPLCNRRAAAPGSTLYVSAV